MSVRIATFNVENLTRRFDFTSSNATHLDEGKGSAANGSFRNHLRKIKASQIKSLTQDTMQLTAKAIGDTLADIVCLQEVDSIETLKAFERKYLRNMPASRYRNCYLIEGNDGRGIDVAVMTREKTADGDAIEVLGVKSHAEMTYGELDLPDDASLSLALDELGMLPDERVFRRDCLEVTLTIGGKELTLFVAHLKSMGVYGSGLNGRLHTMPVRLAESLAIRNIIERKFNNESARNNWLVCGDLNDYRQRLTIGDEIEGARNFSLIDEETSGFDPLISDGFSNNLVARRPADDQWTLYYSRQPDIRHLVQLDYILASRRISEANPVAIPDIIRNGQPFRIIFPPGQEVERYSRTGWNRPKASDHCPVAVTLEIK